MGVAMSIDLKPCPFCGSLDVTVYIGAWGVGWGKCRGCGLETPTQNTRDAAVAYWNTRTPAPPEAK